MIRILLLAAFSVLPALASAIPAQVAQPSLTDEVLLRVNGETGAVEMIVDGTWVTAEAVSYSDPRLANATLLNSEDSKLVQKTQYYQNGPLDYGAQPYAAPCAQPYVNPCAQQVNPCGACPQVQPYYQVPQQPYAYAAPYDQQQGYGYGQQPGYYGQQPGYIQQQPPRYYAQPRAAYVRPYAGYREGPHQVYRYRQPAPRRW